MDFKDLWHVIRRRWTTVVALFVLAIAVSAVVSFATTKQYQSNAQVFIASDKTQEAYAASLFAANRVTSYADLADSRVLLQRVIKQLKLKTTPEKLAEKVTATVPTGTVIVALKVLDSSPKQAQKIAQAEADLLTRYIVELESAGPGRGSAAVHASVVDPADLDSSAVSPRTNINLVVAALIGLIVGLGAAVLHDQVDKN